MGVQRAELGVQSKFVGVQHVGMGGQTNYCGCTLITFKDVQHRTRYITGTFIGVYL